MGMANTIVKGSSGKVLAYSHGHVTFLMLVPGPAVVCDRPWVAP
jgi:hypothetical protein